MKKQLEIKDLKDKQLIRLLKKFEEKTENYTELFNGNKIVSHEDIKLIKKDKIHVEHNLILYLNKLQLDI